MAARTPEPLPAVSLPAAPRPRRRRALLLALSLLGLTAAGGVALFAFEAQAEGWLPEGVASRLHALGLPVAADRVLPSRHFEGY